MIRLIQRRLIIPRGDTGTLKLPVLKFTEGQNVAVFSIINLRTRSLMFKKEVQIVGQTFEIEFTHNETVNLPVGKYVWDIKFYNNPVYADGELINGDEVDSYYAGFSLPECEIRPTGDKLEMSDEAPAATINQSSLDIITAAINEAHEVLSRAEDAASLLEDCSAEAISVESDQPASARYEDGVFYFEIPKGEVTDISGKADKVDTLLYTTLSRGRKDNTTVGAGSFAFGEGLTSSGYLSHAEGSTTTASNFATHAEGSASTASGDVAHAEGYATTASGNVSHAEGDSTVAQGNNSHTEGYLTVANAVNSHAEGVGSRATGHTSHAEGSYSVASGPVAHAEGQETFSAGNVSHSEGLQTCANGTGSHAEGISTAATGIQAHAEGLGQIVSIDLTGDGPQYTVTGNVLLPTYINCPIIDRDNKIVCKILSINDNIITLDSNAFGTLNKKYVFINTLGVAIGSASHVEGLQNLAVGHYSHAEGDNTIASGSTSHTEGRLTTAAGDYSHAEGKSTIASHRSQHVFGENNVLDPSQVNSVNYGTYVEIVGNGKVSPSNARTLDWEGNERLNGTLYINCNDDSTGGTQVATINDIPSTSNKADKVSNATSGNFAALDANGNLIDSGHSHNDYLTAHQDISGKLDVTLKGANNGLAELDANGKVPSSQLPSYVDDVIEYNDFSSFPQEGESGKIYIDKATDITYRWGGSSYVAIGSSLALGETSTTAYRGDRGAAAYAHSVTNKGSAFNSGLYKITTNSEGHVTAATAVEKSDITALGIPASVPTKVSDLQNDSGFISSYTETDPTVPAWAKSSTKPSYTAAEVGALPDTTIIPTKISDLTDDSGHYTKPTDGIPASDIASGVIPDITGKADKVTSATSGNFASLDSNGNLVDSGHKHSDYLTAHQTIPVTDVKINNTTIVNNNVANIPIAGASTLGVVKVNGNGLSMSSGQIQISPASLSDIKTATEQFAPIVPAIEHGAAFYGLAKAAGDTTQSQSNNAIGTYTEDAKTAIRSMLGVASDSIIAVQDTQPTDSTAKIWINDDPANTVTIPTYSEMTDALSTKADKVASAINGNFAALDSNGNLIDSGHSHNDYLVNASSSVFYGLAAAAGDSTQSSSNNSIGTYTETAQSKINEMLNAPVTISETNPTVVAKSGIQYICGEILSLDFTPSATGICDIVFSSGSTPTALTVPSGIKWPIGFNPSSLETNVTYELNILNGTLGEVGIWT